MARLLLPIAIISLSIFVPSALSIPQSNPYTNGSTGPITSSSTYDPYHPNPTSVANSEYTNLYWQEIFSCRYGITDLALVSTCLLQSAEATTVTTILPPGQPWAVSEPCCGGCSFTGSGVSIYYFPSATANLSAGEIVTAVNDEGYIFTSPSIYLAFSSLTARNLCSSIGAPLTGRTTVGVPPGVLSAVTLNPVAPDGYPCGVGNMRPFDPAANDTDYEGLYYYIGVPDVARSLRPEWATCSDNFGVSDPPKALSRTVGLMDPVTDPGTDPTPAPPNSEPPKPAPPPAPPPPKTPGPPAVTSPPMPADPFAPPPENTPAPRPAPPPPPTPPANGGSPPSPPQQGGPAQNGNGGQGPGQLSPQNGNAPQPAAVPAAVPIPALTITLASQQFTYNPQASHYVSGSTTLAAGGPAVVVSGTTVSLAPSASAVIFGGSGGSGGSTSLIPQVNSPSAEGANANVATLTLGGSPVALTLPTFASGSSAVGNSGAQVLAIGSVSLTAGGPAITVSGTRVSLLPSGTAIVVGSGTAASTITLPSPLPTSGPSNGHGGSSNAGPLLTINGATYTARTTNIPYFDVNGTTLVPGGPAITVGGMPVKFLPIGGGDEAVVVGGSAELLATSIGTDVAATTGLGSSSGLGGVIMSGIGGQGPANSSTTSSSPVSSFTGAAAPVAPPLRISGEHTGSWRLVCTISLVFVGWRLFFSV